ncbi:hypothetical protein Tco_1322345, partial [Tanacetum coccineum]
LVLTEPEDSYKDGDGDISFHPNNSSETKHRGRSLERFKEDSKYEHVGQDIRLQGGNDDQDKHVKDLEISKSKTKSKDNDKGRRKVYFRVLIDFGAMVSTSKCKKRKLSQDMQFTQNLRDDQKHMKKAFEDVSGCYEQKFNQDRDIR